MMTRLKMNHVELSVRDYAASGSGVPLVFLHAFPLDQTMWDEQAAFFRTDYRVITFDWREFGESTGESGDASPEASPEASPKASMDVFADDLAGLLDALKIERAVICGLSMGGYAAFAFLRRYPGRVAALVLANTRAAADTAEGKQSRQEMAKTVRESGPEAIADPMLARLLGSTARSSRPDLVARVRQMITRNHAEGIIQAVLAMARRPDSTELLNKIGCPVLVISSAEDEIIKVDEMKNMASLIKDVEFTVIEKAGHLSNIEQSAAFNQAIAKFLARI